MTLWEFNSTVRVYSKIQSGKPDPMTDADFDANIARLRALNLPDMRI